MAGFRTCSLRKQPTFRDATTVFPRNDVWQTREEIPYWWRYTTRIWVVLLIGWSKFLTWRDQSVLACVASISVWFRSNERPRNGILGFGRARNDTRAKKWKWGEGEGKEGSACRQTPRFWKPAFASERSAWLARLVEQCWHVSIKGLFNTERIRDTYINIQWLLFILVGKICPPMQGHFLWPLLKRKALLGTK